MAAAAEPVIVAGMPIERAVTCPHCRHPRVTRAARGTVLRCEECGRHYRAPAVPDGEPSTLPPEALPAAATAAAPAPVPAASPTTGGAPAPADAVRVERARAVKVNRAPAPVPDPAAPGAPPSAGSPLAPPPGQERAKIKGRLGGRGSSRYMRTVGRG